MTRTIAAYDRFDPDSAICAHCGACLPVVDGRGVSAGHACDPDAVRDRTAYLAWYKKYQDSDEP